MTNPMPSRLSLASVLVTACCLAWMVSWVSGNLNGRFQHKAEVVSQQGALLHREPLLFDGRPGDLPEFRGRVLMPAILAICAKSGLGSASQWFVIWRIVTAAIMFGAFMISTRRSWPWSIIGGGLLAYVAVLSFNHPWEHPTDFLDVAFTVGFCSLTLQRRSLPLLGLAIVAAGNRESAAFAGVVWAFVHGRTPDDGINAREVARGALIAIITYAVVLGLRRVFELPSTHHVQTLAFLELPTLVAAFARHPNPYGWPVLLAMSVTPILLLGNSLRPYFRADDWQLFGAAVAILGVTLAFGMVNEMRVFLPAMAVAIFTITEAGTRAEDAARSISASAGPGVSVWY